MHYLKKSARSSNVTLAFNLSLHINYTVSRVFIWTYSRPKSRSCPSSMGPPSLLKPPHSLATILPHLSPLSTSAHTSTIKSPFSSAQVNQVTYSPVLFWSGTSSRLLLVSGSGVLLEWSCGNQLCCRSCCFVAYISLEPGYRIQ